MADWGGGISVVLHRGFNIVRCRAIASTQTFTFTFTFIHDACNSVIIPMWCRLDHYQQRPDVTITTTAACNTDTETITLTEGKSNLIVNRIPVNIATINNATNKCTVCLNQ